MPALHRFDVILQATSGLPADAAVNTWHFYLTNGLATDYDNVRDILQDFYVNTPDTDPAVTTGLSAYFTSFGIVGPAIVKAYDLTLPEGSPPVYTSTFSLGVMGSAEPLPAEIALCFSFQGDLVTGVDQARRRNRKYLGPFGDNANQSGRPATNLLRTLAGAGRDLLAASDAAISWTWVWHSPTTGEFAQPTNGWIDNAWDTQRRRGVEPSARLLWNDSLPPVG